MVSRCIRDDWCVAFGINIYFSAGQCRKDRFRLLPGGVGICAWLLGNSRYSHAIVLPVEPRIDLHLSRTSIQFLVLQNRCILLFGFENNWLFPSTLSRSHCITIVFV